MHSRLDGITLFWHDLAEIFPDGIAIVDTDGIIRFVNSRLESLSGYRREELVGKPVEVLVPPKFRRLHTLQRDQFLEENKSRPMGSDLNLVMLQKDGDELVVDISLSPVLLGQERWIVVVIRDDRIRRDNIHIESELRIVKEVLRSEQRFRLAFENNTAGMLITDLEDRIVEANTTFAQMLGRDRDALVGISLNLLTHPDDQEMVEKLHRQMLLDKGERATYSARYISYDGKTIEVEVSRSTVRDETGRPAYFITSVRDVTEERLLTMQLAHRAMYDNLTGLANRALFEDHLTKALQRSVRQGTTIAVLLLDLDDFKAVNDTLGHKAGDSLLVAVAERLSEATRSSDTLSRFGGDEFLYLAENITSAAEAEEVARRLLRVFEVPLEVNGHERRVYASLGVVVATRGDKPQELLEYVDVALYESKRRGKGLYTVFTPEVRDKATTGFQLIQDLQYSLDNNILSIHYQPILELATEEIVGFEALMRWKHPERGWVSPEVFIPLAEQSGLIIELGRLAFKKVMTDVRLLTRDELEVREPFVSINLSPKQLHDQDLLTIVRKMVEYTYFSPDKLVLEITEPPNIANIAEIATAINALKNIGVRIALSNFGTEYASLSYLPMLRPDIIKIDRSLIGQLSYDLNKYLVEAIISLGHKSGMVLVAEGIETITQLNLLKAFGCDLGQGHLFFSALPADVRSFHS